MMLKKFRCLALVLALVLVVVSGTTFAAKKPIKLIYGESCHKTECYGKGMLCFKDLVEKRSKGQILVECFFQNQLGSFAEMYQAVRGDSQQMISSAIGELVQFYSKFGTFDLPYLYRDQKHYLKVAKKFTSLIDHDDFMAQTGMRIISVWLRNPRQLTAKFPVNKLEDIKGMKIRIPQQPTSLALWKALGAVPTVITGPEVITALTTGVVVAQENPLESIYKAKLYEKTITPYCALTAHKMELYPVVVNNNWWKSLTVKERKIITNAMNESTKMVKKLVMDSDAQYKESLIKVGMKFTEPDLAPFRKKAQTIWGQYGDKRLIKKIQAVK
jgi:tripartite ATP-independent transporter DctP family solute receptor